MPEHNPLTIVTERLQLVAQSVAEARAAIERLSPEERAHVSPDWLAKLNSASVDFWTLGFDIREQPRPESVGQCGFKGPPDAEGMVEIAYGIHPSCRGQGFATEAAAALAALAWQHPSVRIVRAHTLADNLASARVLSKCGFHLLGEVFDPEDGMVLRWEQQEPRDRSTTLGPDVELD